MKKTFLFCIGVLFISGCALNCHEMWGQKSMWADGTHFLVSIDAKKMTKETAPSAKWGCMTKTEE